MTVQELCYMCQQRPMVIRQRATGKHFECPNCDSPNGVMPEKRHDEYPIDGTR